MKRFVKITDLCWWNEWVGYDEDRNNIYETRSGYYLASYRFGEKIKNIVVINSITSCVVRHIEEGKLFFDEQEAIKELKILNKK